MKRLGVCRFCDIIAGKYTYLEIDQPFVSTNEFIAIPSIGALVEGWSLIIPRNHELSMKNVYRNESFGDFLGKVLPLLANRYGSLIAFEHGANKEGSITACGTDHAHLHLVPFGEPLLNDMRHSNMSWIRCRASEIASITEKSEYLFYHELGKEAIWQDPVGYLHVLERPVSQYFRHLIANRKGLMEVVDYRKFPHVEIAKQTRAALVEAAI